MKKYLIFDLDGTLVHSLGNTTQIVYRYLKNKFNYLEDDWIYYHFRGNNGTALRKILDDILEKEEESIKDIACDEIYFEISKEKTEFFEGVIDKVKELSKSYKLFLTTGNSTQVAQNYLKEGGIYDLFEVVLGSDKIFKGEPHLEYFKEYSGDEDFYKNSVYTGDGNSDREFAKYQNIDFIHIGNEKIDKYEITSVAEIDTILNNF